MLWEFSKEKKWGKCGNYFRSIYAQSFFTWEKVCEVTFWKVTILIWFWPLLPVLFCAWYFFYDRRRTECSYVYATLWERWGMIIIIIIIQSFKQIHIIPWRLYLKLGMLHLALCHQRCLLNHHSLYCSVNFASVIFYVVRWLLPFCVTLFLASLTCV